MRQITKREFLRMCDDAGFKKARHGKGSHIIFKHNNGKQFVITEKPNSIILIRLIKEYNLK